jgi:hypothetical protein
MGDRVNRLYELVATKIYTTIIIAAVIFCKRNNAISPHWSKEPTLALVNNCWCYVLKSGDVVNKVGDLARKHLIKMLTKFK